MKSYRGNNVCPFSAKCLKIGSYILAILLTFFFVSCSGKKEVKPAEEFDPEKSLARATELIEKKEYEEARKVLLEVKNRDLTKKYAPLAHLKIADSYAREEEPEMAIEEYRKFIEMYPDNKFASYAQYQIAMSYFNQIEGPEKGYGAAAKAQYEFERLKQLYPRNPYKEIIELRIEKCKNIMADYEFLVGEFYFKKGSYNAAVGRFESLLAKFPDYRNEPLVLFHIALSYKRLADKDKAQEYIARLTEKYPHDRILKEAKKEFPRIIQ
jgi:outer membrane protein assembly factor BamD